MNTSTHIESPLAPLQMIFLGNHATPMRRRDPHTPFNCHAQRHDGEALRTRLPGASSFGLARDWLIWLPSRGDARKRASAERS